MRSGHVKGVIPVAQSEKAHLAWYQRQQDRKKATAVKLGQFAVELRKQLEGT